MAIKDVLLILDSYPQPPPTQMVEVAIALAQALKARISAMAWAPLLTGTGNLLADKLLDMPSLIIEEGKKGLTNAENALAVFQSLAESSEVFQECILERFPRSVVDELLVRSARVRDLTIVPISRANSESKISAQFMISCAEAVVFGSGRPVILLPRECTKTGRPALASVVVAWDGSRPAARAVADALPILEVAEQVCIFSATDRQSAEVADSAIALATNLSRHGVNAIQEQVRCDNQSVADALRACVTSHRTDLLIMGAFGHSRLREAIFGGTTRSFINDPPTSLLVAH
jgi:nucleotide-binding universal stress UspA family protein